MQSGDESPHSKKKKPKEHGRVPSAFEFQREARSLATAAAATAAATVATTTAASTVATTAAASASTTAFFAGASFVDGQRASAVILLVQATDRFVGGVIVPHLDESETFAPTGVPVLDDLSALHRAELAEQGFQVRTRDFVAQITNVQLLSHLLALPKIIVGPADFPGRIERSQMWWLTRWERRWKMQPMDSEEPTQRVASSNQPTKL